MLPPTRPTSWTPKELSRLWRRLFRKHYGCAVPGSEDRAYWPAHYMGIRRLTELLGDPLYVAALFHWWFAVISSQVELQCVVSDPMGLIPWLPQFEVFLTGNQKLIQEAGPEKAIALVFADGGTIRGGTLRRGG